MKLQSAQLIYQIAGIKTPSGVHPSRWRAMVNQIKKSN